MGHLPPAYLHALKPFKYILCESGKLSDFAELSRECKVRRAPRAQSCAACARANTGLRVVGFLPSQTCKGWTASNANLYATCYTCLATFHLTCLDPPLSSKPSRGYAWNCKYARIGAGVSWRARLGGGRIVSERVWAVGAF